MGPEPRYNAMEDIHQPLDPVQTPASKLSRILDSQPSCIEFSPANRNYFVVGTYFLEADKISSSGTSKEPMNQDESPKKPQSRNGSLILFRLQEDQLTCLQTITTPFAILDLHFSRFEKSTFAVATSVGSVHIYRLDLENGALLVKESVADVFDPAILVLSLAWHCERAHQSMIAISSSDGQIMLFDSRRDTSTDGAGITERSQTHSLEAWAIAWSAGTDSVQSRMADLYSGSDDSSICRFSVLPSSAGNVVDPDDNEPQDVLQCVSRDRTTHGAGVTAILQLTNSCTEDFVLTGSYDEHVRILKLPRSDRPAKVLDEKRLNGGVWRLRLVSTGVRKRIGTQFNVIASCMHAGVRFLRITRSGSDETVWSIEIVAKFEEHESMNYASDGRVEVSDGERGPTCTVVSTSFYDRKLCVWRAAQT